MVKRLSDATADLVTRRRGAVLTIIALLTLSTGGWIPTLVADPRPQQLTASSLQDQSEVSALFNQRFGDPDHVVVLLVQADDVLDAAPLAYVHQLSRGFAQKSYVDHVESITVTALALPVDADAAPAGDLNDLDDLDDLDDLTDDPDADAVDPEMEDVLGALVRASPERFPMGLVSIANRLGVVHYGPAVEGEQVTEADAARLRRALRDAPLLERRIISRDHRLTAVALFLDERVSDHRVMERSVRDIDAWLVAHPPPAGVSVDPGGLPHIFNSIIVKMEQDNLRIIPLTLLVCLVLLFLSFRWIPGMILPVAAVGISTVMLLGSMAFFNVTLNVINNIIPPLLIIVGVSDSIHLLGRYREELEHASSKMEAAKRTVSVMAVACFLTSLTTAVGLASLVVSRTGMLQRFGLLAAAGVLVAYIVTIGFLPSAMTYFKPPLAPRERRGGGAYRDPDGRPLPRADRGLVERGLVGLTAKILRRPFTVIGGAVIVVGVFVFGALQIQVDSRLLDEFDEGDPAAASTRLMEEKLEGVRPLEIMLEADEAERFEDPEVLRAIDETQRWLRDQPGVLGSISYTDFLHEGWARAAGDAAARTEPFTDRAQVDALMYLFGQAEGDPLTFALTDDRQAARVQVRLADIGAKASLELIERLQHRLDERFGPLGVRISMTGEGYTGSVGLEAVVDDLLGSLSTAVFIIFGMLVVLFGSWRLGLLSIPPNVIPIVGTLAWMGWRGIPLNAATVIVFSISLGLAVDGSIHLLARYQEEISQGRGRNVAIVRASRGTGRAIVVSCVTLMLGFGVMLLSAFVPVRRFGELIGVSVALCLFSTLIVQPALLRVAAPKSPPNRFRKKA